MITFWNLWAKAENYLVKFVRYEWYQPGFDISYGKIIRL